MSKKKNKKLNFTRGINLYNFAKKIIPGGSMLYSKRAELYLPDSWPSYFSKAKDCFVWDLNNKKFVDQTTRLSFKSPSKIR